MASLRPIGVPGSVPSHFQGVLAAGTLPSRTTLIAVYVLVGLSMLLSCIALVMAVRAASRSAFNELTATHLTITGDAAWREALLITYPNPVSAYADDAVGVRVEMPQGGSTATAQRGILTTGPAGGGGTASLPA